MWIETIGGVLRDGLDVTEVTISGKVETVRIARFRVAFPVPRTVLVAGMDLSTDLTAPWYTFDLRRADGRLLWRRDRHPGHEAAHGGLSHAHIGPAEDHRIAAGDASLEDIAAKIVATHINLA